MSYHPVKIKKISKKNALYKGKYTKFFRGSAPRPRSYAEGAGALPQTPYVALG